MNYESDFEPAKKMFYSDEIQKSWRVHMLTFYPLLEDAFAEDYSARITLTAALNHISRQNFAEGLRYLDLLEDSCTNDTDTAALLLFRGVCSEMQGKKDDMLSYYREAGKLYTRFYWPYLKVAKSAHADAIFDVAERNYRAAIRCFDGEKLPMQSKIILASAYTNYASCLTVMHRFAEAEATLKRSEEIRPEQPGREASWAVLYAAKKQKDKAQACLTALQQNNDDMYAACAPMVQAILAGKHPHFSKVRLRTTGITHFWGVFCKYETDLADQMRQKNYDVVRDSLRRMLRCYLHFLDRDPDIGLQMQENTFIVVLSDFYMVSLNHAYQKLLEAKPPLANNWIFMIAH
ncbi:MAG: hypothetical protein IJX64_06255 [Clostridia bacterium]|nr:hypothetical protein [Clostridia bacterium]